MLGFILKLFASGRRGMGGGLALLRISSRKLVLSGAHVLLMAVQCLLCMLLFNKVTREKSGSIWRAERTCEPSHSPLRGENDSYDVGMLLICVDMNTKLVDLRGTGWNGLV